MQFKRQSDSYQYAILWWTSSILIYIGLAYYAVTLIMDVKSRAFYVQTTITEAPPAVNFPDVMVCSEGHVRMITSPRGGSDGTINATVQNYDISDMTEEDIFSKTPCVVGDQTLSIISMNGVPVRAIDDDIRKHGLILEIVSKSASVPWKYFSEGYASIKVIPFENNPYTKFNELQTGVDNFPRNLANNMYTIPQNHSILNITPTLKATKTVRKDFMGLFGEHNDELMHSVTSTSHTFHAPNICMIMVSRPSTMVNGTQFLITTIPSAFSGWGGASGALWAIFYILFGVGRIDAFGLISNRLLRRTTQRHLTDVYGYWKRETDSSKQQEPRLENSAATSGLALLHSMTCEEIYDQKVDVPLTIVIPDANEKPKEGYNGVLASVLKRLGQQDECIKSQMMHIQRQEQHIKKIQKDFGKLDGLLRDYYLEMDLANEADPPIEHRRCW